MSEYIKKSSIIGLAHKLRFGRILTDREVEVVEMVVNSVSDDAQVDLVRCGDCKHIPTKSKKYADGIAALTASNEVIAKSKPKWISVNERLPDVNKRVLACASILGKPFVWDALRWNGEEWEAEKEAAYEYWTPIDFPVTHWMPLPEPPKEESDG